MRADIIDGGPLGKNVCYANCTHTMVNLLKSWKVTVVGIECDIAAFNVISRRPGRLWISLLAIWNGNHF